MVEWENEEGKRYQSPNTKTKRSSLPPPPPPPPPTVMTTALVEPAKRSEMEWRPLQEGPTLINPALTSAGREIDEPQISCDRTAVA